MAQGFRDLVAWQKAMKLVVAVYRATRVFPSEERFGLTAQMRRAAVSIPSNVAEGHARQSPGEFRHLLGQARGSAAELETQVEIARELGYSTQEPPTRCASRPARWHESSTACSPVFANN